MNELEIEIKDHRILFVFFSERFNFGGNEKAAFLSNLKKQSLLSEANEIILPIPDDAPPEIPLMFLLKAGEYEIKFMRNRIDYTIFCKEIVDKKTCQPIIKFYSSLQERTPDLTLKNIGFVIYSYFNNFSKDEINTKLSRLLSDGAKDLCDINISQEFLLRNLYKKNITVNGNSIDVNLSITLNSAIVINDDKKLAFDFDINTFPSQNKTINKEFIDTFINQALCERNIILDKLKNIISL